MSVPACWSPPRLSDEASPWEFKLRKGTLATLSSFPVALSLTNQTLTNQTMPESGHPCALKRDHKKPECDRGAIPNGSLNPCYDTCLR